MPAWTGHDQKRDRYHGERSLFSPRTIGKTSQSIVSWVRYAFRKSNFLMKGLPFTLSRNLGVAKSLRSKSVADSRDEG